MARTQKGIEFGWFRNAFEDLKRSQVMMKSRGKDVWETMKPKKNESGWATIDDAAKYLSVHRETIMEWMEDGLEYYHLPQNQVRIKYTDIDKFMIKFKKKPKLCIYLYTEFFYVKKSRRSGILKLEVSNKLHFLI